MDNEIKGYYFKKEKILLEDFIQTIEMLKNLQDYNEVLTDSLQKQLILEYTRLIPEIPYFKGYRHRMFNNMLIITSQVLAVHNVFKKYDNKPDEVWEICHAALQLRLQQVSSIKISVMNIMWNTLFRAMMIRRAKRNVKETLGNFELEYIIGDGNDYDYGINYTKCGHHKFLKEHNAMEILPYVCLADISLSDAFGWGLIRTQTIGDGCSYCDFRFKKGNATKITSRKPDVQNMIDRLTT